MSCNTWMIKNFPLDFSLNFLANKKKKLVVLLSSDNLEYKGKFKKFNKKFSCVLSDCLRLSKNKLHFTITTFEIIFIRGENVISIVFL